MTNEDIKRAKLYELYVNGNAYIPLQDLVFYKRSYDKMHEQVRDEEIVKNIKECMDSAIAMIQREDEQLLKLLNKKLGKK